jgi:hypothetical protein
MGTVDLYSYLSSQPAKWIEENICAQFYVWPVYGGVSLWCGLDRWVAWRAFFSIQLSDRPTVSKCMCNPSIGPRCFHINSLRIILWRYSGKSFACAVL